MMKLKQINKGYKCPNCKKFGLEPIANDTMWDNMKNMTVEIINSELPKIYCCKNCYAEFEEVKEK